MSNFKKLDNVTYKETNKIVLFVSGNKILIEDENGLILPKSSCKYMGLDENKKYLFVSESELTLITN